MSISHDVSPEDIEFIRGQIVDTAKAIRKAVLGGGIGAGQVVARVTQRSHENLTPDDLCALLGVAYWIIATMDGTVDDES